MAEDSDAPGLTESEALSFHRYPTPGKIEVRATKPMATQRDLSLAYSPGVAWPVKAIAEDVDTAYDYTSKGNTVAVVSNGTAILGLGALGAAASKPVMEGKAVLFKRFADVDSIDVEVDEQDVDRFVECVRGFGASFGGINLEDISAPACFEIEDRLRAALDVPVFHDDQHGTAIIAAAGLLNACDITGRTLDDLKVVVVGAGAAGLSVLELIKHLGVRDENAIVLDKKGVVYEGRSDNMHKRLAQHAVKTDLRTLEEAVRGCDCLLGLSAAGVVNQDMVRSMAPNPIIFAMANPDPEIMPDEVKAVRDDAIVATGRSDFPNQVNNVLGFPYIFRGALDVRAREINLEMKVACARALAELAREDVPDEVAAAYHGRRLAYGKDYIIPAPFDPRLISYVPPFVAQAAKDTGVARKPIRNMDAYRHQLERRLDPSAGLLQRIHSVVRSESNTVVFAEGEEPAVIRAAHAFQSQGLGKALLVGRDEQVRRNMRLVGLDTEENGLEIINARLSDRNADYVDYLYKRVQRRGFLHRDAQRLVNLDRNVFSACMVALGDADAMVTGVTRHFDRSLRDVRLAIDPRASERVMGITVLQTRGRTLFVADTNVLELPSADELADIAIEAAAATRRLGFTPRVALLSYSTFGQPPGDRSERMREAVGLLEARGVDFEFEGEMAVDVALNADHRRLYPFSRLTEPANVLVMPSIHAASIASRMVSAMDGADMLGPLLLGLSKSVQICRLGAPVSEILSIAAMAAYDVAGRDDENAIRNLVTAAE